MTIRALLHQVVKPWVWSALVASLMRRGLTPDQAEQAAVQMTQSPMRSLWSWLRKTSH